MTASGYLSSSAALLTNRAASLDVNVMEKIQVCEFSFPITSDNNNSSCIYAEQGHEHLHVIFNTSTFSSSKRLVVEVTLMNVDDCNSPAWTWFVESECAKGLYTECSSTQITQIAEFTTCALTCYCVASCDSLYLMHNRLPLRNQTTEQLCELWALRNGRKWLCTTWLLKSLATRLFSQQHVRDRVDIKTPHHSPFLDTPMSVTGGSLTKGR